MKLKSIKLAGFKSFVDPTTVHLPGNMCGVVGPNGCGKSNIIDAVRWVMGESSAKNLRGESMTDVIFNGSVSRAPVSQASIELVFDNSDQSLLGEFARFNEISVRRKVTRDGQSIYYLNGNKCRRKDITDLFLGTGLGPRSYAIIEQGMISRLIESRPEELRIFIEEAAGISRYKERRKETENRIKRTRENLERLKDIREELDRQLQTLQRQARTAEKYREYKAEERTGKARLAALRWRLLEQERLQNQALLRDCEVELEENLTQRVRQDGQLETLRVERDDAAAAVDQSQAAYYRVGAEISGLEQQLRSLREREVQYRAEQQQLQAQQDQLQADVRQEEASLQLLRDELEELGPRLEELRYTVEESQLQAEAAEQALQAWQQRSDAFNQQAADSQRIAEVNQTRIQQIERSQAAADEQIRRLLAEQSRLESDDDGELALHREQLAELEFSIESRQGEFEALHDQARTLGHDIEQYNRRLHDVQARIQSLKGEQSALLAQESAGDRNTGNALKAWFEARGLGSPERLSAQIEVPGLWERAVEASLGHQLQAGMVDLSWPDLIDEALPEGIALVQKGGSTPLPPLLQGGPQACADWLGAAIPVSSRDEARQRLDDLEAGRYLLLPCGTRIGRDWIITPPVRSAELGSLARQKRLKEIALELEQARQDVASLEQLRDECREQIEAGKAQERALQQSMADINRRIAQEKSRLAAEEARREHQRRRHEAIAAELAELRERRGEAAEQLQELREEWQGALMQLEGLTLQRSALGEERDRLRLGVEQWRSRARQDRDTLHALQVQFNALVARREGLEQALVKSRAALERGAGRLTWINDNLASLGDPEETIRLDLEAALSRKLGSEQQLAAARDRLQQIDESLRALDQGRLGLENRIQQIRLSVENLRLRLREAELRQQTHREQIAEAQGVFQEVLAELPAEADERSLEEQLAQLAQRIERLGAINLAAIDEYEAQAQRKVYLDEQNADLEEALETLENAIRKIDRETRQKFKETFDQVNDSLQNLFPKVFGGGSASLELTGDDLLETGVAIMARPPGKKNSTIHLLSGGEKALTAIALVFSIFRLNPAPFCMLDEVDAPLDDANVGRYARMVKEMSTQVQFIYITHNKIAMEMADHLLGVTMHEPGVSRLVAVDVDAAAALAGV